MPPTPVLFAKTIAKICLRNVRTPTPTPVRWNSSGGGIRCEFSKKDRDPNWDSMKKCKPTTICAERADEKSPPPKNHQPPYHQQWCDDFDKPLPKPAYVPRECCTIDPPRRPRKVINKTGGACPSKASETKCGKPETDRCVKILMKGCTVSRDPTTCVRVTPPLLCKPLPTPTPSFHDCVKDPIPPLPPDECHCWDKHPPCEPTKRELADR